MNEATACVRNRSPFFLLFAVLLTWALWQARDESRTRRTGPEFRSEGLWLAKSWDAGASKDAIAAFVSTADHAQALRPMLLKLAIDADPVVRARGLELLGALLRSSLMRAESISESCAVLSKSLCDSDARVRRAAILAYGDTQALPPEAAEPLRALTADADPAIRAAAFRCLIGANLSRSERCGLVREAVRDPAVEVRVAILSVVGTKYDHLNSLMSIDGETARSITAVLDDPWSPVAEAAVLALARLQSLPPEIEEPLVDALSADNPSVTRAAAIALSRLQGTSANVSAALIRALESDDYQTSALAARSLVRIDTVTDVEEPLWRAHQRWTASLCEQENPSSKVWFSPWTEALIQIRPGSERSREALIGLIAHLKDHAPEQQLFAVRCLAACGRNAAPALPALRECASNTSAPDRDEIVAAIARIEAKQIGD